MNQVNTPEAGDFPSEIYDLIKANGIDILRRDGMVAPKVNLREYMQRRKSLDLNALLPSDCQRAVQDHLLIPIESFFSGRLGTEQLFYDPVWLHATVYAFVDGEAEPNFDPNAEDIEPYKHISRIALADLAPLEVVFNRFIWSAGGFPGFLLGGVMGDNKINRVRKNLERLTTEQGIRTSRSKSSRIFHVSVMKNLTAVGKERVDQIIDFIQQRDLKGAWSGKLTQIELSLGDYVNRPETRTPFEVFTLHS